MMIFLIKQITSETAGRIKSFLRTLCIDVEAVLSYFHQLAEPFEFREASANLNKEHDNLNFLKFFL